eukprot:Em0001g640a
MAEASDVVTHGEAKEVVHELVLLLQNELEKSTGINPVEVIKGGSLGHGTAVPGDFDLDLIVYTNSIGKDNLRLGTTMEMWTSKLEKFLRTALKQKYKPMGTTSCSVQFAYKGEIEVEVDILISPHWRSLSEFYVFLSSIPTQERMNFSVCTAKWQAQFFKHFVDDEAKELIKRAKAWRNKTWKEHILSGGRPKSYFLSLLVFYAYRKVKLMHPYVTDVARMTCEYIKQLVRSHRNMDIVWDDGVLSSGELFYRRREYPNLVCSRPRMMDPMNPHNNLYMSGLGPAARRGNYGVGDGKWEWMVSNIDTLDLMKPL